MFWFLNENRTIDFTEASGAIIVQGYLSREVDGVMGARFQLRQQCTKINFSQLLFHLKINQQQQCSVHLVESPITALNFATVFV